EWVWNEAGGGKRYLLGGAWNDPDYSFLYSDQKVPFDRSATSGFRCVSYTPGAPAASLSAPVLLPMRDYSAERPVGDDVYRIYPTQSWDAPVPFAALSKKTNEGPPHGRVESIPFAAGYGGERLPIRLYLPKNVKPPYQGVLFFPGSSAIRAESSASM